MNDTLHPTDWRVIEPEFRARFAGRIVKSMPDRPGGVNPMTPDLLGFVRTGDGGIVEVTTGMFLDHRMYGIVHPRIVVGSDRMCDPRDRSVHSLDELEEELA